MTATVAAILSSLTLSPVVCQPSWAEFNRAAALPPATRYFAGVGGYYDWRTRTIGLTKQTCADLLGLADGYTWQRGYAAFTVAHELGHAAGILDEHAADCFGADRAAQIASLFGLRDRRSFALLRRDGERVWGYGPIPPSCFAAGAPPGGDGTP